MFKNLNLIEKEEINAGEIVYTLQVVDDCFVHNVRIKAVNTPLNGSFEVVALIIAYCLKKRSVISALYSYYRALYIYNIVKKSMLPDDSLASILNVIISDKEEVNIFFTSPPLFKGHYVKILSCEMRKFSSTHKKIMLECPTDYATWVSNLQKHFKDLNL